MRNAVKRGGMRRYPLRHLAGAALVLGCGVTAAPSLAQQGQRLELVNQADHTYLTFRDGQLTEQAAPGLGAGWYVEPTGAPRQARIRSALSGGYLTAQGGVVTVGKASPNDPASLWTVTTFSSTTASFYNVANPQLRLDSRGGAIVADIAAPNAPGTIWQAVPIVGSGTPGSQPAAAAATPTAGGATQLPPPVTGGRLPAATSASTANSGYEALPPPATGGAPDTVQIYVVNRSNSPINVFGSDSSGVVTWLAQVDPGTGLPLQSPVGVIYRLAQGDQWVGSYQAGAAATQVISFPRQ